MNYLYWTNKIGNYGFECCLLTVHLLHGFDEVLWIFEGYKTKSLGFVCALVSDNFGLLETWVFTEYPHQHFIGDVIAEITAEYSKIIWKSVTLFFIRSLKFSTSFPCNIRRSHSQASCQ